MNRRDILREMGRQGGQARAKRLSAMQRKKIASQGGRLRARSLQAARRIKQNFQYLDAVLELTGPPRVKRLSDFKAHLPGSHD